MRRLRFSAPSLAGRRSFSVGEPIRILLRPPLRRGRVQSPLRITINTRMLGNETFRPDDGAITVAKSNSNVKEPIGSGQRVSSNRTFDGKPPFEPGEFYAIQAVRSSERPGSKNLLIEG